MSSGSRSLLGAGVAALRRDLSRVSGTVFLTPAFDWFRGGLSGDVIEMGVGGGLPPGVFVDRDPVGLGFRVELGGVASDPAPRFDGSFGAIVVCVVSTQRWASLSCVNRSRAVKQASVVEHLPR